MATFNSYYTELGVSPTAEDIVIRAAFRALMLKYHPDTNHSDDATRRASDINEAFAVLNDPDRRAQYDRLIGAADEERPARTNARQSASTPPPRPSSWQPAATARMSPVGARDRFAGPGLVGWLCAGAFITVITVANAQYHLW